MIDPLPPLSWFTAGPGQDAGDERQAAALQHSRAMLRVALAAARLGAWEHDPMTGEFAASPLCRAHLGLSPDEPLSLERLRSFWHPDDAERVTTAVDRALATGMGFELEHRVIRADTSQRWLVSRGQAICGSDGSPIRLIGIMLDITDRKETEERQALLVRELHHRVKNTLANVQAIVGSTARTAADIDEFYQSFVGRIVSLGQMYTLLTEDVWQTASLADLLQAELRPFAESGGRITIKGPLVEFPSEAAVPIGMAIHELTINAARYGSLSVPNGSVEASWTVAETERGPYLQFAWNESGGPPVRPPARKGFGSKLLQRVLTAQLAAEVNLKYQRSGFRFRLRAPLPQHPP